MDLVVFAKTELIAVARALREVAATNAVFSPGEADFIEAIAPMHGVVLDPQALQPITPEDLAREITDPHRRKRALQLLIVMALVDGEATVTSAQMLGRFAM